LCNSTSQTCLHGWRVLRIDTHRTCLHGRQVSNGVRVNMLACSTRLRVRARTNVLARSRRFCRIPNASLRNHYQQRSGHRT
jgi:hypothetical protein